MTETKLILYGDNINLHIIDTYIPKFLDILYEESVASLIQFSEIRDSFHSNQIISKTDAVHAFDSLMNFPKTVLYVGSWFGFLTRYICETYPQHTVNELDADPRLDIISRRFNAGLSNFKDRFITDANSFDDYHLYTTIIHLSTEQMTTKWFDKISPGTECVLQSTDFQINDNINPCVSIEDMKQKFNLSTVFYENTVQLNVYNRFTLAGIK